jgi:hypothetical protein
VEKAGLWEKKNKANLKRIEGKNESWERFCEQEE